MRVTKKHRSWIRRLLGLKPIHTCRVCGVILYSHKKEGQKIERLYTGIRGGGKHHFKHRCNLIARPASEIGVGRPETHPSE